MKIGLSQKIAFLLTLFIFCAVCMFSLITINLLKTSLLNQKALELDNSARFIIRILETNLSSQEAALLKGGQAQKPLAEKINRAVRGEGLPYHILYTIYYFSPLEAEQEQRNSNGLQEIVYATNDPFIPVLPAVKKAERYIEKNFFADGDLNILYCAKQDENLFVQTATYMDTDSLDTLVRNLPQIFALASIPLLLLSFFAARFFTARMLRPVQLINRAAQEISAQNLDRRISENGGGDELEELARTFNNLFARLQADFERERRFVSDISHELKTPLAVLLGHLNLLRRWGKNDPTVADKSLETAFTEAKSMQVLIENMLLLSRSENAPNVPVEAVQVKVLLERACSDARLLNPDAECFVLCPENTLVFSDEETLTQVLRILTDNAIRYSPPPAYIEYEFRGGNLIVRDRGTGIASADLPRIFERLYRADQSRNRKTGGSGLGLAIAKSLIQRVNASISAASPAVQSDGTKCGTEMIIVFGKQHSSDAVF